jgi:hypothetical protein
MCIHILYTNIYIYMHRENDCVSMSEGTIGEEGKTILESEKYWNIASMYEDNITQCTDVV